MRPEAAVSRRIGSIITAMAIYVNDPQVHTLTQRREVPADTAALASRRTQDDAGR